MKFWGIFVFVVVVLFSCAEKRVKVVSDTISSNFIVSDSSFIYSLSSSGDTVSVVSIQKEYERIVVLATPLYTFFEELQATDDIKGIYSLERLQGLPSHIQNVSSGGGVDIERLIEIQPDLIVCNSYQKQDLERINGDCEILIIDEYLEHNPIQKASWLIFFGKLLHVEKAANLAFEKIKASYVSFPTINLKVLQLNSFESWFQPGCGNYIAQLISDAGAKMVCVPNEDGSVVVSQESAMQLLNNLDYLLFFDWELDQTSLKSRLKEVLKIRNEKKLAVLYCNTQKSQFYQKSILNPGEVIKDINFVLTTQEEGDFFKILTIE